MRSRKTDNYRPAARYIDTENNTISFVDENNAPYKEDFKTVKIKDADKAVYIFFNSSEETGGTETTISINGQDISSGDFNIRNIKSSVPAHIKEYQEIALDVYNNVPVETTVTPVVKDETPFAKVETPIAKDKTPIAKDRTPVVKGDVPVAEEKGSSKLPTIIAFIVVLGICLGIAVVLFVKKSGSGKTASADKTSSSGKTAPKVEFYFNPQPSPKPAPAPAPAPAPKAQQPAESASGSTDASAQPSKNKSGSASRPRTAAERIPEYEIDENKVLVRYNGTGDSSGGVIIPTTVDKIGKSAFAGKIALTGVVIPGSVKIIEDEAFADCYSLEKIVISNGVVHIGSFAFRNCSSLESVVVPDSVRTAGERPFSGCSLSIKAPAHLTQLDSFVDLS